MPKLADGLVAVESEQRHPLEISLLHLEEDKSNPKQGSGNGHSWDSSLEQSLVPA
jgi:hypothetical protein